VFRKVRGRKLLLSTMRYWGGWRRTRKGTNSTRNNVNEYIINKGTSYQKKWTPSTNSYRN